MFSKFNTTPQIHVFKLLMPSVTVFRNKLNEKMVKVK